MMRFLLININTFIQLLATASPNQGILFTDGASIWGWCPPSFFIELNGQNMEINELSEKNTELLTKFNQHEENNISLKKNDDIGKG